MRRRLVLHVGMPKTATTTFQSSLDAQSQILRTTGVLYPETGRVDGGGTAHHSFFLAAATEPNAIDTTLPPSRYAFEEYLLRLEHERADADATTIVLSSEILWNANAFDRSALARIRSAFGDYEPTVFAFLRPLEDQALSGFAQRVTGAQRFTGSLRQHIEDRFEQGRFDIVGRLADFEEAFGKDAIRPVWLPGLKGDVLAPLRDLLPQLVGVSAQPNQNARRGWFFVQSMRRLNAFGGRAPDLAAAPGQNQAHVIHRLLDGLDRVWGRESPVDMLLNPMDRKTRVMLQAKTDQMLEDLIMRFEVYGLRERDQ